MTVLSYKSKEREVGYYEKINGSAAFAGNGTDL